MKHSLTILAVFVAGLAVGVPVGMKLAGKAEPELPISFEFSHPATSERVQAVVYAHSPDVREPAVHNAREVPPREKRVVFFVDYPTHSETFYCEIIPAP